MVLIKRYPNRKLYDLDTKQYITVEEIIQLIQRGQDIQVIEHPSGKDITKKTLIQAIQNLEKRNTARVPQSMLEELIQSILEHKASKSLETINPDYVNLLVENEILRRIQNLIIQGLLDLSQAEILANNLLFGFVDQEEDESIEKTTFLDDPETHEFKAQWENFILPSPKDLNALNNQLEELFQKLDKISMQII